MITIPYNYYFLIYCGRILAMDYDKSRLEKYRDDMTTYDNVGQFVILKNGVIGRCE